MTCSYNRPTVNYTFTMVTTFDFAGYLLKTVYETDTIIKNALDQARHLGLRVNMTAKKYANLYRMLTVRGPREAILTAVLDITDKLKVKGITYLDIFLPSENVAELEKLQTDLNIGRQGRKPIRLMVPSDQYTGTNGSRSPLRRVLVNFGELPESEYPILVGRYIIPNDEAEKIVASVF